MINSIMHEEVIKRNFAAVNDFMKKDVVDKDKIMDRIKHLENMVVMQQTEINNLRQQLTLLLARQKV